MSTLAEHQKEMEGNQKQEKEMEFTFEATKNGKISCEEESVIYRTV